MERSSTAPAVPTFGEYIPKVESAVPAGSRRTYSPYWRRINAVWGHRRLTDPTVIELRELIEQTRKQALLRQNSRNGRSSAEHMISALRCLYRLAADDGYLSHLDNPALRIDKPKRHPSPRTALPNRQLAEIAQVVSTSGPDPVLDILIIRIHMETACRTGSALALRPVDLNREQCLIRLYGKNETIHWQPVSPTLMEGLVEHLQRGGVSDPTGKLLRHRSGRPITRRHYELLWRRVRRHLPWAATQQISTHWLRHTTLTWVERNFGYAVARAFAFHADPSGRSGTTLTYTKASMEEIATALAIMTGEPHPLGARPGPQAVSFAPHGSTAELQRTRDRRRREID